MTIKTEMQRKLDLLSFKSSITHSLAQSLLADENFDMDSYLNEWAKLLLNGYEYNVHEASDVIIFARNNAQEEVNIIRSMQARGISIAVEGHGGSAIRPSVLAEYAVTKEDN